MERRPTCQESVGGWRRDEVFRPTDPFSCLRRTLKRTWNVLVCPERIHRSGNDGDRKSQSQLTRDVQKPNFGLFRFFFKPNRTELEKFIPHIPTANPGSRGRIGWPLNRCECMCVCVSVTVDEFMTLYKRCLQSSFTLKFIISWSWNTCPTTVDILRMYLSPSDKHKVKVAWNNCFRKIFNACWLESGKPLLFYCNTLSASLRVDQSLGGKWFSVIRHFVVVRYCSEGHV